MQRWGQTEVAHLFILTYNNLLEMRQRWRITLKQAQKDIFYNEENKKAPNMQFNELGIVF